MNSLKTHSGFDRRLCPRSPRKLRKPGRAKALLAGVLALCMFGRPQAAAEDMQTSLVNQIAPEILAGPNGLEEESLTPERQLGLAHDAVREVQDHLADIGRQIEAARKAREIAKLNCLTEKSSALGSLLVIITTSVVLMEDTIGLNDSIGFGRLFRRVLIARREARSVMRSASECETREEVRSGAAGEPNRQLLQSPIKEEPELEPEEESDVGIDPPLVCP